MDEKAMASQAREDALIRENAELRKKIQRLQNKLKGQRDAFETEKKAIAADIYLKVRRDAEETSKSSEKSK